MLVKPFRNIPALTNTPGGKTIVLVGMLDEYQVFRYNRAKSKRYDEICRGHPSGRGYRIKTDFAIHIAALLTDSFETCNCSLCPGYRRKAEPDSVHIEGFPVPEGGTFETVLAQSAKRGEEEESDDEGSQHGQDDSKDYDESVVGERSPSTQGVETHSIRPGPIGPATLVLPAGANIPRVSVPQNIANIPAGAAMQTAINNFAAINMPAAANMPAGANMPATPNLPHAPWAGGPLGQPMPPMQNSYTPYPLLGDAYLAGPAQYTGGGSYVYPTPELHDPHAMHRNAREAALEQLAFVGHNPAFDQGEQRLIGELYYHLLSREG